jgi:hypothetical protein
MFTWVEDIIMFPSDPMGRNGPTFKQFLMYVCTNVCMHTHIHTHTHTVNPWYDAKDSPFLHCSLWHYIEGDSTAIYCNYLKLPPVTSMTKFSLQNEGLWEEHFIQQYSTELAKHFTLSQITSYVAGSDLSFNCPICNAFHVLYLSFFLLVLARFSHFLSLITLNNTVLTDGIIP